MSSKVIQNILSRSNAESFEQIVDMNGYALDLETSDLSFLNSAQTNQVKTMSLSHNLINSLKPFKSCHSLEELYLRKNRIESLAEIAYLKELRNLKVLWLWDNPCSEQHNY